MNKDGAGMRNKFGDAFDKNGKVIWYIFMHVGFLIYKAKNGIPVYESQAPKLPT